MCQRPLLGVSLSSSGGCRSARCLPTSRMAWPDSFVGRLKAMAVMQTLNAEILASRSATRTLEAWCATHDLAPEPRIVARRSAEIDKPATAEQRHRLQVDAAEPVKYRRVQLVCGEAVLSEADNWYVPGRLTAEMNRLLETSQTPFGRAVQALEPYRQTFAVELLWEPLPDGWELAASPADQGSGGQPLDMPEHLFITPGHALHQEPTAVLGSGRVLPARRPGISAPSALTASGRGLLVEMPVHESGIEAFRCRHFHKP